MGFTCFLCKEPFDKDKGNRRVSNNGAGDAESGRGVSATKCGHLFHADCLKLVFDKQSGGIAWAAKSCPVCRSTLAMTDVFRVQGCNYDMTDTKRAALEEVLEIKQQLQHENSELLKRLEASFNQCSQLHKDIERMREEKEETQLRIDQIIRLNVIYQAESDRQKVESDKLKNLIVTMSARFTTGTSQQEYNGGTSLGQLPWASDDRPGMPRYDVSKMVLNNESAPPAPHPGHPPGLLYPMARPMENSLQTTGPSSRPRESNQAPANQINSSTISPDAQTTSFDNGMMRLRPARSILQQNLNVLNFSSQHENRGYGRRTSMGWENAEDTFPKPATAASKEQPLQTGASGSPTSLTSVDDTDSQSLTIKAPSKNGGSAMGNLEKHEDLSPMLNMDDDDFEAEDSGKWHEKRGRRRIRSKGSSSSNSNRQSSSKPDFSGDKKLYGQYACPTCNAKWGSSQSVLNKPQICRYCRTEVHPHSQGPILSRRQLELNNITDSAETTIRKKK